MIKVTLYKMSLTKNWQDMGKGSVRIFASQLIIESEEELEKILESNIERSFYSRQFGNLLQCIDSNEHYILSFETSSALNSIWREIIQIQGFPERALPYPSPSTISRIFEVLNSPNIEEIISQENLEDFLVTLCQEFMQASENLEVFFEVFKLLVNSCAEKIIKELLGKHNFSALLKALEMDPELKGQRKFGSEANESLFQNVLETTDEGFLEFIHLNFRIQTFKDALITKTFDERLPIILNSFQMLINEEIIRYFSVSIDLRNKLCEKMKNLEIKALLFVSELLVLAKSVMNPDIRFNFYQILAEEEIVDFFSDFWNHTSFNETEKIRSNTAVIKSVIELFAVTPWNLKKLLLSKQAQNISFFEKFVCEGLDLEIEPVQLLGEFLKLFMQSIKDFDFSQLSDIFFDIIIKNFEVKLKNPQQSEFSKCEILSILSSCINNEPVASRFDFVLSGLLDTIRNLLISEKFSVKISIFKLYHEVVKGKDTFLLSHFAKSNYFSALFGEIKRNLLKENLIFSSALSVLDEISKCSNLDLLEHIYDNFQQDFQGTFVHKYFEKISTIISTIPSLDRSFSSVDLIANENFIEVPQGKPSKRSDSQNTPEPVKKLKLI